jgi:hypothetical protein
MWSVGYNGKTIYITPLTLLIILVRERIGNEIRFAVGANRPIWDSKESVGWMELMNLAVSP